MEDQFAKKFNVQGCMTGRTSCSNPWSSIVAQEDAAIINETLTNGDPAEIESLVMNQQELINILKEELIRTRKALSEKS